MRAVADFTYRKKGRIQSVTARVFVFGSPDGAAAFFRERWLDPKFKDVYQPIDGVGDEAVDVVRPEGRRKRALRLGNLIVAASEVVGEGAHLQAIDEILKRTKSKPGKGLQSNS